MTMPTTAAVTRRDRLSAIEDDIRRRLWARERAGNERAFDQMVTEIAWQQYASESGVRTVIDLPLPLALSAPVADCK